MEPLTALSTASNALQLFDISWKLVSSARDIYNSRDGRTLSNKALEAIADNVTKLSASVAADGHLPPELHGLNRLSEEVASELCTLLSKVKAKGPHSTWQSFAAAVKETWSRGRISEFADRIQQLQTQTIGTIQFFVMNKQSDVYSEILSLQQATRDLGAKFQVALDRMRQDVLGQLSQIREASVQEQIQRVLKDLGQLTLEHPIGLDTVSAKLDALADSVTQLQRRMKVTRSYQSVLRAVRFERLKFRHDRISVAHAETFGWVFEDEASGVHGPLSLHFRKWLRDRDGIFWIRGKAGSGKSTLMKFLCGDERTYDNLAAWATGPQRLVVARYFFWSAGTSLQRSQEGLFRSLIYDILCQRPDRIPMVQKRLVQRQEEIQDCEEIWTGDFTWQTLKELISENSPDKICFFIDGLDEYDGDSENLLQTIKLFARLEPTTLDSHVDHP